MNQFSHSAAPADLTGPNRACALILSVVCAITCARCAAGDREPSAPSALALGEPVPVRAIDGLATVDDDGRIVALLEPTVAADGLWTPATPEISNSSGEPIVFEMMLLAHTISENAGADSGWPGATGMWLEPTITGDRSNETIEPAAAIDTFAWLALAETDDPPRAMTLNNDRIPVITPPKSNIAEAETPLDRAHPRIWSGVRKAWRSPLDRWRVALLADRLDAALPGLPEGEAETSGAMAHTLTARWRWAIDHVTRADERTGRELRAVLSAVAPLEPDGPVLPVWTADPRAEGALLAAIVAAADRPQRMVRTAQAFLESQPEAVAWMSTDAADRSPVAAITSVCGHAVEAVLSPRDGRSSVHTIEPGETVRVPLDESEGPWEVRVGRRSQTIVAAGRFEAGQRGPVVRVLAQPSTQSLWRSGLVAAASIDFTPAWRLIPPSGGFGWSMAIEAPPPLAETEPIFELRFAGGDGRVRSFELTSGGLLRAISTGTDTGDTEPTLVRGVVRDDRGIVLLFELPGGAIDATGRLLRFGLAVRTDDGELIGTWPQPVLPGGVDTPLGLIRLAD